MFNALNCRGKVSIFQLGFFTNKFFTFAIGGSIFMQLLVIYLPFFQVPYCLCANACVHMYDVCAHALIFIHAVYI